ncbi:MAG: MarR family transcriptional regulator [Rhizobiales bacterium]|nr:MarR family transcriptional regulator [Hyphomicrobiales bacterium]
MAFNHKKSISLTLTRTARMQRSYSAKLLSKLGLHPGQEAVLKALNANDGQTMSQLAKELGVRPPTITKMISRLEAQGYVERRASKSDGRQAYAHLSASGIALLNEVDRAWKSLEKAALQGIDDKDQKRLRKLLKKIESNLNSDAELKVPSKQKNKDD